MKIVALDDEKMLLEELVETIYKVVPDAEVAGFQKAGDIISYVRDHGADVAFLDIKLRGSRTGIDVAKELSELCPKVNVIFCTGYGEYALDAIRMHCSGYITKPVSVDAIKKELAHLRNEVETDGNQRVKITCFGNFEVFVDDKPVAFTSAKTKELLAYLVDRKGAFCSNGEIVENLWEDGLKHDSYLKKIKGELHNVLVDFGLEEIVIVKRGEMAMNLEMVSCDYYDWLHGKLTLPSEGIVEYMEQYSWAEYRKKGLS